MTAPSILLDELEDEAGKQLQLELQNQTLRNFDARSTRPILHHLNADSSWLLSLPYAEGVPHPVDRCRFNIVIDVWLTGPQVDGFKWFSAQEHAHSSAFRTLQELNNFLQKAETTATGIETPTPNDTFYIDAVLCSHEFTDHCHQATLTTLPSETPILAPRKAASLIRSWKYFSNVTEIPVYSDGFHWRESGTNTTALPPWVSCGRIYTKGDLPIHFHSALAINFKLDAPEVETIIYTPHGISAESLAILKTASPQVSVLALIHGLHDISLAGAQLNLGKENAIRARELTKARYWLPTHDEVKIAHGIVAKFLRRIAHTSPLAPGSHPPTPGKSHITVHEQTFVDVKNGQSIILD